MIIKKFKKYIKENKYVQTYTIPGGGSEEPIYFSINNKIRQNKPLNDKETEHFEGLKSYIKSNSIDTNHTLYRGIGHDPGEKFTTSGITSSTSEYDGALQYATNHSLQTGKPGHVIKMNFSKGDLVSHDIAQHSLVGESEHLIHPGIKLKKIKSEYNDEDNVHIHHYEVDKGL